MKASDTTGRSCDQMLKFGIFRRSMGGHAVVAQNEAAGLIRHGPRGAIGDNDITTAVQQNDAVGMRFKRAVDGLQQRRRNRHMPRDFCRALQMRQKHLAAFDITLFEFTTDLWAHDRNRAMQLVVFLQRDPQHRVHVTLAHETVIVIARQQCVLRQHVLIRVDDARAFVFQRLNERIARAPNGEEFHLAWCIDADGNAAAFHRFDIAIDDGRDPRAETLAETLERDRPILRRGRCVVNGIDR